MSERNALDLIKFVLAHRDEMIAHLARRLGSGALAEEVLRETLQLLRSRDIPARVADPRTYLVNIATHLGIDRLLRECAQSSARHQLDGAQRAQAG